MTLPTHVLAGLVIGKITGDFPIAIAGSIGMDFDHLISYCRHGILFKPRRLLKALVDESDPWGDQRNLLHNAFVWVAVSIFLFVVNFRLGMIFSIAYLFHLILDALDTADYYPFFPFRTIMLKGFVKYYSKQEAFFALCLLVLLLALFLF